MNEIKYHRFCSTMNAGDFSNALGALCEKKVLAVLPGVKEKEYKLRHGVKVLD